jgi:O-antigen/teichoic acid export membrane protein
MVYSEVRVIDSLRWPRVDHSLFRLIKNTAFAGVSAASAGLLLLLLMLAGRLLGTAEYGKFVFALGLGTTFETLMDFGLNQVAIRAVARDNSAALRIFRNALGLKIPWALAAMATLMVAAAVLRNEPDVRLACCLVGGSLVLRSYMLIVRGVLQGLERFGWDSLVVITDRLLLLLAGSLALWAGTGLQGLGVAFVISRAVALVLAALLARAQIGPVGISLDRGLWRELQWTAIPLGLFLVVINLYSRVDVIMLGVLRTDAEVGFYTNAFSIYEGLTYLPSVLSAVFAPRLAAYYVTDRRKHRTLAVGGIALAAGCALAVGAVTFVVAEPLVTRLFGPQYSAAASPLRVMSAGLALVYVIWILHTIAISMNRERLLLVTGVVGLVAKVALNAWLIPRSGPTGAAAAVVTAEAISITVLGAGLAVARVAPAPHA